MRRTGIAILFAVIALDAHAGAWKLEVMGARALGRINAGDAAMPDDASTVWFNPAGMTFLAGTQLTAGVPVIDLKIRYDDQQTTSLLGQPVTGPRTADAGTIVAIPHGYLTRKMSERLWLGVGFNTPFGLGTDYGDEWVGRYQATNTELLVYNLNPSFAWKVSEHLSLGAGANLQYGNGSFGEKIDFGSIGAAAGLPLTPQQSDGEAIVRGHDFAVGWNAGVMWHPLAGTMAGVTWRSHTDIELRGPANFTVPAAAQAFTAGGLFANTRATATLPMPETISVSVAQHVTPSTQIVGDATWTRWSRFRELTISFDNPAQPAVVEQEHWVDTRRYSIGVESRIRPKWLVRGGLAFEESPVPEETREPRIPEADHRFYAIGASYLWSNRTSIDFFILHGTTERADLQVSDPTAGTLRGTDRWNIINGGVGLTLKF